MPVSYTHLYDIVFTTIPLTTDKSQFFVKPVMDEITMRNLRNKVFNQLRNINSLSLDYNALMSIIAVSYTHLDVYKRQMHTFTPFFCILFNKSMVSLSNIFLSLLMIVPSRSRKIAFINLFMILL